LPPVRLRTERQTHAPKEEAMSQLHHLTRICLLLLVAVVVVGGAHAAKGSAPIAIDSVTIGGGVATITGVVDVDAQLEINGQPADISAAGEFVAAIDLDADALVLTLLDAESASVTLRIPTDVLIATGGDGVLDALIDAGVSIEVPPDGFTVVDGQWPLIEGHVIDDAGLASLTVNGVDVLDRAGPAGGFSVQMPWTQSSPSQVTVVASDHRGVSQTTTYTVTRMRSVIRTRMGTSVSAAGARGLVIAGLRFDKRLLAPTGRLRVLVTVKDRRGYLVRGAALRLSARPWYHLATGSARAGFTNRFGRAQFTYRLRPSAFAGPRNAVLTVVVRAKTPTAGASRKASLLLPVLADH